MPATRLIGGTTGPWRVVETGSTSEPVEQPFAESAMGDSMGSDLSGETSVAAIHLDEDTGDLLPSEPDSEPDLITSSLMEKNSDHCSGVGTGRCASDLVGTVRDYPRGCVRGISKSAIDSDGRLWRRRAPPAMALQLVVPSGERRGFIHSYHDAIFAGHLGVSRTVCRLLDRVYWPGLREDIRSYLASCSVCLARKSPVSSPCAYGTCFRWSQMGPGGYGYYGQVCYHGKG